MSASPAAATAQEPIAWLHGRWLPASQATVSVYDSGFLLGATVAEQLRTFGGKVFRLEMHLDRLARSLAIVGVDAGLARGELAGIASELAARNHKLLDPADDLGLTIFVTPGPNPAFAALAPHQGPTVCVHTQPLPFAGWAGKYESGDALVITDVRQIPAACWPPELKCRSRMHYFLADRDARQRQSGARALVLDERGLVTEASSANILAYCRGEGLISPPAERILPGVTVAVVEELAGQLGIPFVHRDLTPDDVAGADEVLLCSTSPCVWSVTQLDGQPIADGKPGPIARRLREAFSRLVGLDIEAQAKRFASRT